MRKLKLALPVLLLVLSQGIALADGHTTFVHPFWQIWVTTDGPAIQAEVDRTWLWGPWPVTNGIQEPYAESVGGARTVQYFDKARMEINDPPGQFGEPGFITNGLLVVEMSTGRLQLGDNTFEQRAPASQNVAGDQTNHTGSPTYATVHILRTESPRGAGELIIERADRSGYAGEDASLAVYGMETGYYVPETDQTIAKVFWDFMNTPTLVSYVSFDGTYEALPFGDVFSGIGFPIMEAYWVTVPVGGEMKDVLLQCFERRCMTYTPDNPPGWKIEAGNVGLHYLDWRYGGNVPTS